MQAQIPTFRSVTAVLSPMHTLCMAKGNKSHRDAIATISGERISAARTERKWSQKELSLATGWDPERPSQAQTGALSPSRIANFEQGTRRVGIEEAVILCRVLGSAPPYWMGLISAQEAAVLQAIRAA